MIEVDIYETGKHYMKGRLVEESPVFTPSIAQPLMPGEVSGLVQVGLLYLCSGTLSYTELRSTLLYLYTHKHTP